MAARPETSDDGIYGSGEYLAKNPGWHEEDAPWKASHVQSLLDAHGIRADTVCEVGTGSGEVLRLLADGRPQATYHGFDISPHAMRIATPKSRPGLIYELGSPFDHAQRFDLALALDVFEHVPDYLGFLRRMATISTYQVYNIPLDWSIRSTLQPGLLIQLRERIGHLHYFNRETALASLRDTGHEVIGWRWHSPAQAARGFKGAIRRGFFAINEELCVNVMGGFAMTVLCRSKSA